LYDISAQETPGGRFDIKNDKTIAPDGPNTGELLNGMYATARSAGNYLAGYNAAIGVQGGVHYLLGDIPKDGWRSSCSGAREQSSTGRDSDLRELVWTSPLVWRDRIPGADVEGWF